MRVASACALLLLLGACAPGRVLSLAQQICTRAPQANLYACHRQTSNWINDQGFEKSSKWWIAYRDERNGWGGSRLK